MLVTTGHAYDTQDYDMFEGVPSSAIPVVGMRRGKNLKDYPPLRTPNVAFRNRGNRTFEEIGARWGFASARVSHGMCLADLDNDGDLDVVVNCLWEPALVYRNESSAPRVAIRLKGKSPNTKGIGASIKVLGGAVPVQTQQIICGGRYLSSDDPMRVFAAGSLTNHLTIEVTWRGGGRSIITNVPPNYEYEVDEAGAQAIPALAVGRPEPALNAAPLFQEISERLGHQHKETPFNDLERQPLLPKRLSQLGPGIAWFDLDGDGHDDLVIGNGKGAALAVYRNEGRGILRPWTAEAWNVPAPDDLAGLIGWTPGEGRRALLVGIANYESPDKTPSQVLRYDLPKEGAAAPALNPAALRLPQCSIGPLCAADINGDGRLEVFVGGRVVPGRYPESAASYLYQNHGGKLELDAANSKAFERAGLVSGAVFSDLDGDGLPELLLACEWGPVRVFKNQAGKFREITDDLGLARYLGWWNSLAAGDVDGDGRMDIIAGNWGLNSSYYQPSPEKPISTYYGDFDGNSSIDLIEACLDPATGRTVPRRDMMLMQTGLPTLRAQFPTHAAYSLADARALLGSHEAQAQTVRANTLASMVFLNRGTRFEAVALPDEAQWAPVFGINVADLDGDGIEDLFLSQNFFAMRLEEPRLDSGRGLLLRGRGNGTFTAASGRQSGIAIYGEQRGSALADFDEDGRVDLVVSQNNGATRLFRNAGAKPGLRIRLAGGADNPDGIGAVIRLKYGEQFGPAREIHAGGGYWSQDSAVQVMAAPQPPTQLWVRWPGGRVTTSDIPAGAREVRKAKG